MLFRILLGLFLFGILISVGESKIRITTTQTEILPIKFTCHYDNSTEVETTTATASSDSDYFDSQDTPKTVTSDLESYKMSYIVNGDAKLQNDSNELSLENFTANFTVKCEYKRNLIEETNDTNVLFINFKSNMEIQGDNVVFTYKTTDENLNPKWYCTKDDQIISINDTSYEIISNRSSISLKVLNVSAASEGKYMCKYEIDESHYEVIIAKMFRYELDVKRLEKEKINHKAITAVEGSHNIFECKIDLNISSVWYWTKDNEKIEPTNTNFETIKTNNDTILALKILNVDISSKGKYECKYELEEKNINIIQKISNKTNTEEFHVHASKSMCSKKTVVVKEINLDTIAKRYIFMVFSGIALEVAILCALILLYERVYSKKNEYTFSHDLETLKHNLRA